jgi:ubiquinone/menaquinone biosynthesis C-methylase UbiE
MSTIDLDERSSIEYFDRCAADGVLAEFEPEELERLEAVVDRWRLAPGERVLEVGCGSGRLTRLVGPRLAPGGEVIAFDVSLGMMAAANRRRPLLGARLAHASVSCLPLADGAFDRALCFCVLPHLLEPARAFAELHRVLRPGGTLWIDHLADRADVNAFHRSLGGELAEHLIPPDSVVSEDLESAGFEVVELGDGPTGYRGLALRL